MMTSLQAFIREYSGLFSAEELAAQSPRFGLTSAETERAVTALLRENRIATDCNGKVGWVYDPERYHRYQARPDLRVRQG
jgi:hypothetical protein